MSRKKYMKVQISELNDKPAFDYCRQMLPTSSDPTEPLYVYRGDTLAFSVSSLKWGSERSLHELSNGGFRTVKYRPMTDRAKRVLHHD